VWEALGVEQRAEVRMEERPEAFLKVMQKLSEELTVEPVRDCGELR
jgi:hypothetical protein